MWLGPVCAAFSEQRCEMTTESLLQMMATPTDANLAAAENFLAKLGI
jgi:hypothetical protein